MTRVEEEFRSRVQDLRTRIVARCAATKPEAEAYRKAAAGQEALKRRVKELGAEGAKLKDEQRVAFETFESRELRIRSDRNGIDQRFQAIERQRLALRAARMDAEIRGGISGIRKRLSQLATDAQEATDSAKAADFQAKNLRDNGDRFKTQTEIDAAISTLEAKATADRKRAGELEAERQELAETWAAIDAELEA